MTRLSRVLAFSLLLLTAGSLLLVSLPRPVTHAQGKAQSNNQPQPEVYGTVGFGVSPALRDIKQAASNKDTGLILEEDEDLPPVKSAPLNPALPRNGDKGADGIIDPLLQLSSSKTNSTQGLAPLPNALPAPMLSFDGNSNADNAVVVGGRVSPPDTNGDVGLTQYVQTVNLVFSVYNKTTGARTAGPAKMSSIFAAAGVTGVCATNDNGDPIVLYDQLADRWMISQFAFASSTAPPYHQCIAVSKTGDATGAYFAYDFITPGANFNDYPHFGVWPDAYYMTDNQFLNGGSFNGAGAFAFDRAKMLRGDPSATFIYFNQPAPRGGQLPTDMDGLIPPPPGTPNYFLEFTSTLFGSPEGDAVKIFEFHADFVNPANSTFTLQQNLPVATFDPRSPSGRNVIEQPSPALSTHSLDAIQDRLLYRVQYRNFGTRDALVLNHTVNVSGVNPTTQATHQAGIRYYDLRRGTPGSGLFAVGDQGTFSPDAGNGSTGTNRWMGSVAQDNQGNLALGYSTSSTSVFPSINYTGRLFGDPAGTLQTPEQTLVAGTGVQRSTGGRWGDYSMLGVDPRNDCDFWFTSEYYTAASQATSTVGWLTRIGSFKFAGCTAPQQGTLNVTVTNCETGTPVQGASVTINGNLYGDTIANGTFSTNLPPGTYTVSITGPSFSTVTQTVTITDGSTVSITTCLIGVPVLVANGSTLVNESCPPANGAIDPGETVTVNLNLMNSGSASTSNLVATLQPNANVLAPSGPQNYGVIPVGGSAGRDFSFTAAGNCGDLITLTLQLQDGANNLGTVTYTRRLGVATTITALSENFDGVTPPALPAGWTTAATGVEVPWVTSATNPSSAPNDAFAPDPTNVGNTELITPSFAVPSGGAQLTFRNLYNMESGFDGMVLEISVNGGAFTDITTGGNAFIAGGYNATISASFANPIAGRMAWSGLSGGTTAAPTYITSTINLPAAAAGQNVQLKWRAATDNSVSAAGAAGVRIDSIVVSATTFVCNTACAGAPRIATSAVLSCSGGNTVATIRITNSGTATANNVVLTTANLGGVNGTPLPQTVGSLAPGASMTRTVTFSGAPSGATGLLIGGSYDGSTFSSTRRVTAPACTTASLAPSVPFLPSLPAILLAAVVPPSAQTGR